MLAAVDDGHVRCWTRHGTELTCAVGDVLVELGELLPDATLIDGELVALASAANGHVDQDFYRLGQRCLAATTTRSPSWSSMRPEWPASSSPADRGTSAARRSSRCFPLAAGGSG